MESEIEGNVRQLQGTPKSTVQEAKKTMTVSHSYATE